MPFLCYGTGILCIPPLSAHVARTYNFILTDQDAQLLGEASRRLLGVGPLGQQVII
jgi:hypothetical protein